MKIQVGMATVAAMINSGNGGHAFRPVPRCAKCQSACAYIATAERTIRCICRRYATRKSGHVPSAGVVDPASAPEVQSRFARVMPTAQRAEVRALYNASTGVDECGSWLQALACYVREATGQADKMMARQRQAAE